MKTVVTLVVVLAGVSFSGCSCELEGIKCTEDKHCPSDMFCNTANGVCEQGSPPDRDAGAADVGEPRSDVDDVTDVGEVRSDGGDEVADVASPPDAGPDSGDVSYPSDGSFDAGDGGDAGCEWGIPEDGVGCCDNRYANNCTGCQSFCAHDGEPIRCICDWDGGMPDAGPSLDGGADVGQVPDGGVVCIEDCPTKWANAEGECDYDPGTCKFLRCHWGYLDCNRDKDNPVSDGCEIGITNDVNNCGMCGDACATNHVSPECKNMTCGGLCDQDNLDCNEDLAKIGSDGCEIDKTSDPQNCGACARSVAGLPHVASAECAAQDFRNIVCEDTYWNNDSKPDTGCEYGPCTKNAQTGGGEVCNLQDDDCDGTTDNGAPTVICPLKDHAAPTACTAGSCSYTCEQDYGDCDNVMGTNGCETNIKTSLTYCGACGIGHTCVVQNGTPTCDQGACKPASCNSGYKIDPSVRTPCSRTCALSALVTT